MAKSDNLRAAKANKNDEFYTRLEDIEAEISQHEDYVRQFQGKTVFCNCDDPKWSNFFVFFMNHFVQLGLKKLITTHYNADGSPSYKIEWTGEMLNDETLNLITTPLKGNGDFRSEECIEILKEADIVVTNPPFSLFREYVNQLIEYKKQFVVLSNMNAIAYKEFFPHLKSGLVQAGYGFNLSLVYKTPYPNTLESNRKFVISKGFNPDEGWIKVPAVCWFTNLDLDKSHEPLILNKNYYGNESKYPKYDNFDAIECGKVKDIPKDYFPCWYKCPHADNCTYAKTEGKEDKALCEDQFHIVGDDTELANPELLDNGKTGNGRFYLIDEETEKVVQPNCHSQVATSVMDLLESQSHSSQNSALSNLESLVLGTENEDKKLELEESQKKLNDKWSDIQQPEIYISSSMENQKYHTTESSFRDCHKCNGLIGVPITFIANLCSEQFTIIGHAHGDAGVALGLKPYPRELKKLNKGLRDGDLYRMVNGYPEIPYNRIIIQRRKEDYES